MEKMKYSGDAWPKRKHTHTYTLSYNLHIFFGQKKSGNKKEQKPTQK